MAILAQTWKIKHTFFFHNVQQSSPWIEYSSSSLHLVSWIESFQTLNQSPSHKNSFRFIMTVPWSQTLGTTSVILLKAHVITSWISTGLYVASGVFLGLQKQWSIMEIPHLSKKDCPSILVYSIRACHPQDTKFPFYSNINAMSSDIQ